MAAAMLLAARSGVNAPVSKQVSIGPFDVLVVYSTPTPTLVVAGLVTALAFVLLVLGLDAWAAKRVTDPARRSGDVVARPLRSEATITRPSGRVSVTALIPARNEELHIAATLESLRRQTVPPTAVWVIADNCTDATAEVARAHGADVYTTVDNRHRKAGGLNQLLARLLPTFGPLDAVLVMDADTVMVDDFLERAVAEFDALPDLDAVGGVFFGDDSPGLLAQLQRNEYLRYGRDISRRQGPGVRADRHGVAVSCRRLGCRRRRPGIRAARRCRRRLRHVLAHRRQRTDARPEDARRPDGLTSRLSGDAPN